jgi:Ca2+-binding RTX toxin-like protein
MSRFAHIIGVAALAVLTLAGSAIAAHTTVVRGTRHADHITTGNGSQTVYGLAGADRIETGKGSDVVYGGAGADLITTGKGGANEAVFGGRGNDRIHDTVSGQHPGYLNGGPGHDVCVGTKNTTYVSCEVVRWRTR